MKLLEKFSRVMTWANLCMGIILMFVWIIYDRETSLMIALFNFLVFGIGFRFDIESKELKKTRR